MADQPASMEPAAPTPVEQPALHGAELFFEPTTGRLTLIINTGSRLDVRATGRIASSGGMLNLDQLQPGLRLRLKVWNENEANSASDV